MKTNQQSCTSDRPHFQEVATVCSQRRHGTPRISECDCEKLRGLSLRGLQLCRAMNRLADALVGSAPADIAAHKIIDFVVGRTCFLRKQRGSGHDLAALAITTLRHVDLHPGLL